MPSFERIRFRQHDGAVFLFAFDLIELNGNDLRREPLEVRKATLASLLKRAAPGLRFNEHIEADGPTVFAHACKRRREFCVFGDDVVDEIFDAFSRQSNRLDDPQPPFRPCAASGCRPAARGRSSLPRALRAG
jgi:hypothetical protein